MACCEMCGRNVDNICRAIIEGSILNVCSLCSGFGVVLVSPLQKIGVDAGTKTSSSSLDRFKQVIAQKGMLEEQDLIVKDYGEKVRKAREKKGLTQEELAKAIAEKVSVIQKVEAGQMKPTLLLAKRLQQFLGVELIEKYEEEKPIINFKKSKEITIGDLWEMEKKQKGD
ncbi:TIGR00270 family protein [archaeon]|nr:TIGR00270 family protein [archaeon]